MDDNIYRPTVVVHAQGYKVLDMSKTRRAPDRGRNNFQLSTFRSYQKIMEPVRYLSAAERRSKRLSNKLAADKRSRDVEKQKPIWQRSIRKALRTSTVKSAANKFVRKLPHPPTAHPPTASDGPHRKSHVQRQRKFTVQSNASDSSAIHSVVEPVIVETPEARKARLEAFLARLLRPPLRTARVQSLRRQAVVLGYTELCRMERQKALARKMEIQARKDEKQHAARIIQDAYRLYRSRKLRKQLQGTSEIRYHHRRDQLATKIQALFRGHVARLALTFFLGSRTIMAKRLQRCFRRAARIREAHRRIHAENTKYKEDMDKAVLERRAWALKVQQRMAVENKELINAHINLARSDPDQYKWSTTCDTRKLPEADDIKRAIVERMCSDNSVSTVIQNELENSTLVLELPFGSKAPCSKATMSMAFSNEPKVDINQWIKSNGYTVPASRPKQQQQRVPRRSGKKVRDRKKKHSRKLSSLML